MLTLVILINSNLNVEQYSYSINNSDIWGKGPIHISPRGFAKITFAKLIN